MCSSDLTTTLAHVRNALDAILNDDFAQLHAIGIYFRHRSNSPLKIQPALASAVGYSFYDTVIQIASAIEDYFFDSLFLRLFSYDLAHFRALLNAACKRAFAQLFALRGKAKKRMACAIVDQLHFDMPERAVNDQTRPIGSTRDDLAQPMAPPLYASPVFVKVFLILHN